MLANVASNHLVSGRDASRFGNGHPNIVPYTAYPVRDGMIAVAVGNDAQFAKFAALLGKAEWAKELVMRRTPSRVTNRDALDAGDHGDPERARSAGLARETHGRGHSMRQGSTPWPRRWRSARDAREMVRTVQHPTAGEVKTLGIPFRFSDTPASVRRPPPTLGQHTGEILRDMLKLSRRA